MPYAILAVILAVAGVILLFHRGQSAYYGKIFSDAHYREINDWLHHVLALGPVDDPALANRTGWQSDAECGFTFTREIGKKDSIHIAISQVGRPTTHAVGNRLAFLLLQILKRNKAEAVFFFTESYVHHVVFAKEADGEWLTNDIDIAIADLSAYQPLPFQFRSMDEVSGYKDAPVQTDIVLPD